MVRLVQPSAAHIACRNELIDVMKKHSVAFSSEEVLALISQMVGQAIALQDQRRITPERAMQIVMVNIEAGNLSAIAELMQPPQGRS